MKAITVKPGESGMANGDQVKIAEPIINATLYTLPQTQSNKITIFNR
jgi:hypothetical protein